MTGTNCDLFTQKSVPVIFEPPCTTTQYYIPGIMQTETGVRNVALKGNYMILMLDIIYSQCFGGRLNSQNIT